MMGSRRTDNGDSDNAIPGPSNYQDRHVTAYTEIPSYGIEFFEYRRRLFLANLPLPNASHSKAATDPSYRIPLPLPDPIPSPPNAPAFHTSIGRLEALLSEEGAEETMAVWTGGLAMVHEKLTSGRKLSRPLRLGLVIKVLKAGWIKDGTWPIDPATSRAVRPPDSPFLGPIPPLRTTSLLPNRLDDDDDEKDITPIPLSGSTSQPADGQNVSDPVVDGDMHNAQDTASHGDGRAHVDSEGTGKKLDVQEAIADATAETISHSSARRAHADDPPEVGAEQRTAQVEEAMVNLLMDDERDVRIGDNIWRGAQADQRLPLEPSTIS